MLRVLNEVLVSRIQQMFVHALTHEAWWELVVGWPLPEMTQASVLIGLPSMAGSPVEILDTVTYLIRICLLYTSDAADE